MSVSAGRRRRSGPERSAEAGLHLARPAGQSKSRDRRGASTLRKARPDLAARLRARQRELGGRVQRRDALVELLRAVNTTLEPTKIAELIIDRAATWVPAPVWALVSADESGRLCRLADRGLAPARSAVVSAIARWVMARGDEFLSADVAHDARVAERTPASIVAFPLTCRGRRVAALIALDDAPSMREPRLAPKLLRGVRQLLEPAAVTLDTALHLKRVEALSVTDDLTQLYNSRYLNLVLRRETKRAARSGRPLSLLFLDLDGFKKINDRHGHLSGSRALVEAADVIRGSARETDVVSRFGGDEFALILPDTGAEGAQAVGERIRERIAAHRFLSADGYNIRLTASVGVATLPDVGLTADELVKAADQAMYRVKDRGKNGIEVAAAPADKGVGP